MCDDNDTEGARLWFYGGTPPMDEPDLEDQELHASAQPGCAWRIGQPPERATERPAERAAA